MGDIIEPFGLTEQQIKSLQNKDQFTSSDLLLLTSLHDFINIQKKQILYQLNQKLSSKFNLQIIETINNGNCMYDSIGKQIALPNYHNDLEVNIKNIDSSLSQNEYHRQVRKDTAGWLASNEKNIIRENGTEVEIVLSDYLDVVTDKTTDWGVFVKNQEKDKTWGTHISIIGISNAYNRIVYVYQAKDDTVLRFEPFDGIRRAQAGNDIPLYLIHIFESHYYGAQHSINFLNGSEDYHPKKLLENEYNEFKEIVKKKKEGNNKSVKTKKKRK